MDIASARRVMFGSYFYLMIVLVSLYANRIKPNPKQADERNKVKEWITYKVDIS
jgi:hypothetical protein